MPLEGRTKQQWPGAGANVRGVRRRDVYGDAKAFPDVVELMYILYSVCLHTA